LKTFVFGHERDQGCIICLPGRLGSAMRLMEAYASWSGLNHTMLVGIETELQEWYPLPNGVSDQEAAVEGMKKTRRELLRTIKDFQTAADIPSENIALVGFSAGAVMAIQCAVRNDEPFAAVVSHSGAILQPRKTPPARFNTPILLMHNRQDDCFKWDERYKPMRSALRRRGYYVHVNEKDTPEDRHSLTRQDVAIAGAFLAAHLGCHRDGTA